MKRLWVWAPWWRDGVMRGTRSGCASPQTWWWSFPKCLFFFRYFAESWWCIFMSLNIMQGVVKHFGAPHHHVCGKTYPCISDHTISSPTLTPFHSQYLCGAFFNMFQHCSETLTFILCNCGPFILQASYITSVEHCLQQIQPSC